MTMSALRRVRLNWYDAVGATIVAAFAAWTIVSAVVHNGNPVPQLAVVAAAAAAYMTGRRFGVDWQGVVRAAASVVLAILIAVVFSGPEVWSGRPLAPPLGYGNANGSLYVLGVGASVVVAISAKPDAVRATGGLFAALFTLLATASLSRTAAILAAGILLVTLVAHRLPRWAILLAPLITGATVAVTILLGVTNGRDLLPPLVAQLSARRPQLWAEAMEITGDEPVFGAGPGQFAQVSPTAMSDSDARWAHSAYLQIAAELGLPGLTLVAILLLWVIGALYLSSQNHRLAILGAAIATAFSVHAAIDYVARFAVVTLIAAFLVGMCSTRSRTSEFEATAISKNDNDG